MSNKNWLKRAKRVARQRYVPMAVQGVLFVPEFVKRAAALGLNVEKPLPQLPAPKEVGDPGMLEIRKRDAALFARARPAIAGQRVVGQLQQASQRNAPPVEIDSAAFLADFGEAQRAGRTRLTMREFERLLALPYK